MKLVIEGTRDEMMLHLNAGNLLSVITDLDDYLRAEIKHQNKEEFQPIRDKLWQLLNDNDITPLLGF